MTDATVSAPSVGVVSTVPWRIGVLIRVSWSLVGARCAPRRRDTAERLIGGVEHPGVGVEAVCVELEHGPGHPPKRRRTRERRAHRARQLIAQEQWSKTVDGDDQGPHLGIGGVTHRAVGDAGIEHRGRVVHEAIEEPVASCRAVGQHRREVVDVDTEALGVVEPLPDRGGDLGRRDLGLLADELRREPLVARLPQGLLRPEVMDHEGRADARVGGDLPNTGAVVPLRAESRDRRVPDPGRRRRVLESY